jgi:hypothetical protein
MKIKAVNKGTEKYGFPQELDYNNPSFNGHQIGIAVCVQNMVNNEIEENYLSEKFSDDERDFLLGELLREKALLIVDNFTQLDDSNELTPKAIYYMPYFVLEHSRLKPTVINDNVSGACNVSYDIKIEVIFVHNGLSRYITVPVKTRNSSVMDCIYGIFDTDEEFEELGIKWKKATEDEEEGYELDFYNEAGERFNLRFNRLENLRDAIVSVRMIECDMHIDGEDNENTIE